MENISMIHPNEDDVIVHTFGMDTGIDDVYRAHSNLIHAFPNNTVIAIPDTDAIHCLDKQSTVELLQSMISMLQGKEML